jgi:hypothetical protein
MGFFRHSSTTVPTDTTPASTTLSARTPLLRFPRLALTGVLAGAGLFAYASAGANPPDPATSRSTKHTNQSVVNFTPTAPHDSATNSDMPSPAETSQDTNVSISSSGGETPHTSVTVNGQPVTVPQNGIVSQTSNDENGHTSLEIHSSTQGTASNSSSTSLNMNVSSSSTSFEDNSP